MTADARRKGIDIFAKAGSPVIAVQDGRIVKIGRTERLGTFIQLRDVYGNTYTYGHLKKVAQAYPVPKERRTSKAAVARELKLPKADPKPTAPASAGRQPAARPRVAAPRKAPAARPKPRVATKERLFAHPARPSAYRAGGEDQLLEHGAKVSGTTTFRSYFTQVFGLKRDDVVLKRLKVGSKVVAGTILGRIGTQPDRRAPTSTSRSARPARTRRGSTPSRSSTAGSCSRRPRSTARPAPTRSSAPTPRTRRSARSCS